MPAHKKWNHDPYETRTARSAGPLERAALLEENQKLRERVRELEQALSQERGLVDRVDMILALGPDEKPRTD